MLGFIPIILFILAYLCMSFTTFVAILACLVSLYAFVIISLQREKMLKRFGPRDVTEEVQSDKTTETVIALANTIRKKLNFSLRPHLPQLKVHEFSDLSNTNADSPNQVTNTGSKDILFFIHGWPDNKEVWTKQYLEFSSTVVTGNPNDHNSNFKQQTKKTQSQSKYRCLSVDLPHFNQSQSQSDSDAHSPLGYSPQECAEMIVDVLIRVKAQQQLQQSKCVSDSESRSGGPGSSESDGGKLILICHDWGCVIGSMVSRLLNRKERLHELAISVNKEAKTNLNKDAKPIQVIDRAIYLDIGQDADAFCSPNPNHIRSLVTIIFFGLMYQNFLIMIWLVHILEVFVIAKLTFRFKTSENNVVQGQSQNVNVTDNNYQSLSSGLLQDKKVTQRAKTNKTSYRLSKILQTDVLFPKMLGKKFVDDTGIAKGIETKKLTAQDLKEESDLNDSTNNLLPFTSFSPYRIDFTHHVQPIANYLYVHCHAYIWAHFIQSTLKKIVKGFVEIITFIIEVTGNMDAIGGPHDDREIDMSEKVFFSVFNSNANGDGNIVKCFDEEMGIVLGGYDSKKLLKDLEESDKNGSINSATVTSELKTSKKSESDNPGSMVNLTSDADWSKPVLFLYGASHKPFPFHNVEWIAKKLSQNQTFMSNIKNSDKGSNSTEKLLPFRTVPIYPYWDGVKSTQTSIKDLTDEFKYWIPRVFKGTLGKLELKKKESGDSENSKLYKEFLVEKTKKLKKVGHWLQWSHSEAVNAEIRAWIETDFEKSKE